MKILRVLLFLLIFAPEIVAGPREQAYRLHNRLTGVPPSNAVLNQMQFYIQNNDPVAAAREALQNPRFYNVVLKNWVKRWTNEDQTTRVPLNDFVATIIGVVRDDIPFDQILYGDILYTGNVNGITPYAVDSNDHYQELEERREDLSLVLTRQVQSQMNNIPDTAGVLTTRAAGEAFYQAGTNRAVTRFTFMNFLCHDFEALHDITVPDVYVRRDIDRRPGGDSRTYRNRCVGCHAGQDAIGGAMAYFDWDGSQLVYTLGTVAPKINLNNLFNDGSQVTDDSWVNLWATGQNASLGWRGPASGQGMRSFGRYIARSQAFAQCMAESVYKIVCLKTPERAEDQVQIQSLALQFEANNSYNMKDLVARTSVLCLGE